MSNNIKFGMLNVGSIWIYIIQKYEYWLSSRIWGKLKCIAVCKLCFRLFCKQ